MTASVGLLATVIHKRFGSTETFEVSVVSKAHFLKAGPRYRAYRTDLFPENFGAAEVLYLLSALRHKFNDPGLAM